MVKRLVAIKNFLSTQELKNPIWSPDLETQVNVFPADGERVERKWKERRYFSYYNADRDETWASFRTPRKANSDDHTYTDVELRWDLSKYAQGIGATGWNFVTNRSTWVGFDFDSIIGHERGLSTEEIQIVLQKLSAVEWVTIRKSKGGIGFHVFVFIEDSPEIKNHHEHAAVARSILHSMSGLTGFSFESKVDCVGQVLWLWHRDANKDRRAFQLIKEGKPLQGVPPNWRDHLKSAKSRRTGKKSALLETFRNLDSFNDVSAFADLNARTRFIPLNDRHRNLVQWLLKNKTGSWWEDEHHCIVSHTATIARAHKELGARGLFSTKSKGREEGDHNCFLFPSREGWIVRRYTKGAKEHPYWTQDSAGWTTCSFDRDPDLEAVLRYFEARLGSKEDWEFNSVKDMRQALLSLGHEFSYDAALASRKAYLVHKKGKLIVKIPYFKDGDSDEEMREWRKEPPKAPKFWVRVFRHRQSTVGKDDTNDLVIRVVSHRDELEGFFLRTITGMWMKIPVNSIHDSLIAYDFSAAEAKSMRGAATINPWRLVSHPFESEYPGDRCWNMNSAQLGFEPERGEHPTWDMLFEHMGAGLTPPVSIHDWCKSNHVLNGPEYLMLWVGYLLQHPKMGLPYLCFYSEAQNTGKSSFHEALGSLFMERRGYVNASHALNPKQDFNGELLGSVLCVIEEIDISNKRVYDKLKDWVTSPYLSIHPKGGTPYTVENTTHWIQVTNNADYTPVFEGDTRIVMVEVQSLEKEIFKHELEAKLKSESAAFLFTVLNMELPAPYGRLQIPVIETSEKVATLEAKKTPPEEFLKECIFKIPGQLINVTSLYMTIREWIKENYGEHDANHWTDKRIQRLIPRGWVKGLVGKDRKTYFGNVTLDEHAAPSSPWIKPSGSRELMKGGA